ncbi:glycosyltransferase family 2 protein [uncultured Roseovarius sp.]|uniref:glycosyltransferase n=1 Tax=uncultured Roseovarius sp. TaxID=293344 RepID=UPI00260F8E90|nr:glycosyltransferase family 2 protein [uncultured Roseovarius sp.]
MSVIIAARNEEDYIGDCLEALLAQSSETGQTETILAANACTDRTVEVAESFQERFESRGWLLRIVEVPEPGKVNALNWADSMAQGEVLVFLDADVRCDPDLLMQLREVLKVDKPTYATGALKVTKAKSWVTRRYARIWVELPFVKGGAVGAGLFAVNRAGRARWDTFPDIISDDTFVRLQFSPEERVEVPARYHWPMVEGFGNLVRVRRRQDDGVQEIHQLYPEIIENEAKAPVTSSQLAGLFLRMPVSFTIYALVHVAVRLRRSKSDWARGR